MGMTIFFESYVLEGGNVQQGSVIWVLQVDNVSGGKEGFVGGNDVGDLFWREVSLDVLLQGFVGEVG